MYGCGLRIGEALAGRTRCRINRGTTLRVREQVNPTAQLKPLKFRVEGQFRVIPLPLYVAEAMDKHIAGHGTTPDGYLFQGRRHKHVTRRTYQEDFARAAGKAALPPEFIPHSLRHCYASTALANGIPITEVSRWLGHKSIEVTHQIYGHLVPTSWDRARTVIDDARRVAARSWILRRPVYRSRRGWQRDHFSVDLKLLLTVDSQVREFPVDRLECVLARYNGELPVWPALACGDVVRDYVQLSVVQFE